MLGKRAPRRPKLVPRWVQEGAKRAQERAKRGQERAKRAPTWHQEGPRGPQEDPRGPQDGAKMVQDGPRRGPRRAKTGPDSGKSKDAARRVQQDSYNTVNTAKPEENHRKNEGFHFAGWTRDGSNTVLDDPEMAPRWHEDGVKTGISNLAPFSSLPVFMLLRSREAT